MFTTLDQLITRGDETHLSFGAGIHYVSGLSLDGLAQWQTDPYLRQVTNLPLRF